MPAQIDTYKYPYENFTYSCLSVSMLTMVFPPIYCISLSRSTERRKAMRRQLDALGHPYQIVDAVDGATLDISTLNDRLRQDIMRLRCGYDLTPGEIGCFLSHYQTWESLVQDNIPVALILEDDVILRDDFAEVVSELVAEKWRWDIIVLDTRKYHKGKSIRTAGGERYSVIRANRQITGACAYLINSRAAKNLVSYCYEIRAPIDHLYGEWWHNGLAFYYLCPRLAEHGGAEDSTIGFRKAHCDAPLIRRIRASLWRKYDRLLRYCALLRPIDKE